MSAWHTCQHAWRSRMRPQPRPPERVELACEEHTCQCGTRAKTHCARARRQPHRTPGHIDGNVCTRGSAVLQQSIKPNRCLGKDGGTEATASFTWTRGFGVSTCQHGTRVKTPTRPYPLPLLTAASGTRGAQTTTKRPAFAGRLTITPNCRVTCAEPYPPPPLTGLLRSLTLRVTFLCHSMTSMYPCPVYYALPAASTCRPPVPAEPLTLTLIQIDYQQRSPHLKLFKLLHKTTRALPAAASCGPPALPRTPRS